MNYKKDDFKGLNSEDQVIIITNSFVEKIYENSKGEDFELNSLNKKNSKVLKFKILDEIQDNKINQNTTEYLTVVKDSVFKKLEKDGDARYIRLVDVENQTDSEKLTTELNNLVEESYTSDFPFNFSSYYGAYIGMYNSLGLTVFIGLFLAVVFMLCTGSIIFLKQLSDIYDDKERYIMLKKIGANDKDIEKILAKQLRIIFLLPVIVGTVHNLFAMTITQKLVSSSIIVPVGITLLVYYLGYLMYYLATLKYAKKLIIE